MPKNVGGAAKKVSLSLHELEELQSAAFEMGVDQGREVERNLIRLKTPNDCPHCALRAEHEALKRRVAVRDHSDRKSRNLS